MAEKRISELTNTIDVDSQTDVEQIFFGVDNLETGQSEKVPPSELQKLVAVTPSSPATETVVGVASLATVPEALAGVNDSKIVTPAKMDAYFTALVGNGTGAQNLGAFPGATITTGATVKSALTELENAVEGVSFPAITAGQVFVGSPTNTITAVGLTGDVVITNTGVTSVITATSTAAGKVRLSTNAETLSGILANVVITPAGMDAYFTALIGNVNGTQHLGTFNGGTVSNNVSVKTAIQELETAVESGGVPTLVTNQIYVGNLLNQPTSVTMSGDVSITVSGSTTVVSASTTVAGKTRLATPAETLGGTNATIAVTPVGMDNYILNLVGNVKGVNHLGGFTGSIITDNGSVKSALQELETAHEALASTDTVLAPLTNISGVNAINFGSLADTIEIDGLTAATTLNCSHAANASSWLLYIDKPAGNALVIDFEGVSLDMTGYNASTTNPQRLYVQRIGPLTALKYVVTWLEET